MYVERLELIDYRSYAHAVLDLGPGVTVFVGSNGQGKTNLVEALGYIANLTSHRVASDAPLVREGADRAFVRCSVMGDGRSLMAELEITLSGANRARLNGAPATRPREILGLVRTVLFAPEDLALVKGDPGERRRFLDELLISRAPRMAGVRADLDRVLKQRNALLKSMRTSRGGEHADSTLQVWDDQLVDVGSQLLAARWALIDELRPAVERAYIDLAPDSGTTDLQYRSSIDLDSETSATELLSVPDLASIRARFSAALTAMRKSEIERGLTLVGPHRDDLFLGLRGLPAKGYASHGESWSIALSLRLASYELMRADLRSGGDPILILDDVFAELDVSRRQRLAQAIVSAEQVLITAAVAQDVPEVLSGERFTVVRGDVSRST